MKNKEIDKKIQMEKKKRIDANLLKVVL